jgi:hypothetical protein
LGGGVVGARHARLTLLLSPRARTPLDGTNTAAGAIKAADATLQNSILRGARKKFLAKKSIAHRHAAHRAAARKTLDGFSLDSKAQAALAGKKLIDAAPDSSLLTRMPVANSAKGVMAAAAYLQQTKAAAQAKAQPSSAASSAQTSAAPAAKKTRSKAAQLEWDIAHHKLTTRGLIAAVHEVCASVFLFTLSPHTHTCTHARTRARTHIHTHIHTHTHNNNNRSSSTRKSK